MSTAASEPEETTVKQADQTETPLESLASICTVLAIGLFVMTFIFQNYKIPSGSMEKTLLIGDHVLVDRTSFAPPTKWAPFVHYRDIHRGDVIVFYKPNPETPDLFLVKRAIGIPGDRIHLVNGIVYLNGVAQNEPQAGKPVEDGNPQHAFDAYRDDFPSVPPPPYEIQPLGITASWALDLPNHIQNGDLVVPPGMVFAMGDNRTESEDGRYWGFVPRQNIVGRPLFVYWSFETSADQMSKTSLGDRLSFIGHILVHFFDETRWRRTFHIIR
ncbi:signal peptidase I [Edaphobacter dinghuensis]|uniref:Signal peptidase I n=1 Tax=Edaphobacter dinghuensis TaxID=1560005 RepID=A0A917H7D3_9BACT|nr:signal peptidase I [Edaphobacter dinghuensis]GGG69507.1 signal peptidase I [Edaphobacter dinghuensis]